MENEVDLSPGNALNLTPRGSLAVENVDPTIAVNPTSGINPRELVAGPELYPGTPNRPGILGTNRLDVSPNVAANPLDNAEAIATKRLQSLQKAISDPVTNFIYHDEVKGWAEEAQKKSLEIQEIKDKRQQQIDIQRAGQLAGLPSGSLPASATNNTLVNELTNRFRTTGDVNTMNALIARGHNDIVATYMPDAVAAQENKLTREKQVLNALDAASFPPSQTNYNKALEGLTPEERNSQNIPKTPLEWRANRAKISNDIQKSEQMVNTFKQQRAQWNDFTLETDKNAAEVRQNGFKLSTGEVIPGTSAVKHLGNGATGVALPPGSNDLREFDSGTSKSWNLYGDKQQKEVKEQLESAFPKTEREKTVSFNRTYKMATQDKDGNKLDGANANLINTNPNVQQAISEGLASALRGGAGGANGQLMKLELAKRGVVQESVDKAISALAGTGAITGKERDYLSKLTQSQIRYVLDFVKGYTDKDAADRLNGVATRAGSYGAGIKNLGLEPELQDAIKPTYDFARDKQKLEFSRKPRIVRDDDTVLLEGGKAALAVPGALVTPLPLSALPGLTPGTDRGTGEIAPAKGSPAALTTVPGSPSPGGGGGTPPANGISKDYLIKTAKVESGGNWTEGNTKTTASGAYQFTNATWNQFKPEGAPNRAAAATPQQQTEAANNLTNANAKVLARNDVPVNDTTAYIAHNLGASGAVNFLKARDDAKARAVVGAEAANNNPLFFKGDPTVAEVKARYEKAMSGKSAEAAPTLGQRLSSVFMQGVPQGERNAALEKAKEVGTEALPAIGATFGMGMGPAGAIGGGMAGGALRNYVKGAPEGYLPATIKGGVEAIPAAIPGVGVGRVAARVVTGGAVPAAEKLYDSGGEDVGGAIESGVAGAVSSAVGEGLGIFGHHAMSMWGPGPAKKMVAAANDLVDEPPKIANVAGKMVDNPKFVEAERRIKASKFDPDQVAHDVRAMREGIPKGEALAKRPAEIERIAAGKELEAVKQNVVAAGTAQNVGTLKPAARLPGDPQSLIDTGKIDKSYQKAVDWAQMNLNAPNNVDKKWNQLGEVRTKLLTWERDPRIPVKDQEAYREIADSMRDQQIALAKLVHTDANGKVTPAGTAVINHLKVADARYARAMAAGAGEKGDIVAAISKGGKEGREAQAAFNAVAANDPQAQRMVRSLAEMEKSFKERAMGAGAVLGMSAALAHFGGPVGALAGGLLTANKVKQMVGDYIAKRGAGSKITFRTILERGVREERARRAGSAIGSSIGNQMTQ